MAPRVAQKRMLIYFCAGTLLGFLSGLYFIVPHMDYNVMIGHYPQRLINYLGERDNQWDKDEDDSFNVPLFDFNDEAEHHDNTSLADELHAKIRVMCLVHTKAIRWINHGVRILETWGKRCNVLLFVSDMENTTHNAITINMSAPENVARIPVMATWDYIYNKHYNDADWFLQVDDMTYVIMENLRYLLNVHEPTDAVWLGQQFHNLRNVSILAAAAGYVLSKETLRRLGTGSRDDCPRSTFTNLDLGMTKCMEMLGVNMGETLDILGRSRFHDINPKGLLKFNEDGWYVDRQNPKKYNFQGLAHISDYPITFHGVPPASKLGIEFFAYHCGVYGVIRHPQDLNQPRNTSLVSFQKSISEE